ncbi:MAG: PAS domain S-box protein [Alphaproteobacteria bacterium]|nr:PAS domain S-box protein [Alphaproteobacteria bacterium]
MPDRDDFLALLTDLSREAHDAVGVAEHGVLHVVNPTLLRMFGYDAPEEVLGRPFWELLDATSAARMKLVVQARAEGRPVAGRYQVTGVRRDGGTFEVGLRTTTFSLGGRQFSMALLHEVGEEEAGESRLYDAIFGNTAIKLLIDPENGRVVDANQAAVQFYGWPLDQLRGMAIAEINTASSQEVRRDLGAADSGEQRSFRFQHRLANGALRNVEVHTGPVELRGRRLLLSIIQDTTERDELEEKLRRASQLEAVGRLAGGVAHDFNNLLTVVLGCADLVRPGIDPGVRQHLDDLVSAARRASRLTRQLLAVGRRQQLAPRTIDLSTAVRTAEALLRRAVPGVDLEVEVGDGLQVEFDPDQLEQVLLNLVINAAEAGASSIRISSSSERDAFETDFVVLTVSDDGRGMDEATQARVFEPFFTTRPGHGSGLGLASVYGIVSQSGGQIEVHSRPGQGTTFALRLARRAAPEVPTEVEPGQGTVLWLVDDHDDLREVLVQGLQNAGFLVKAFRDAEEALAAPGLERVSVLITDQVMPGASGLELGQQLQSRRPELRVLLISGEMRQPRGARLPVGWEFMQKPFSTRELSSRVRAMCAPVSGARSDRSLQEQE